MSDVYDDFPDDPAEALFALDREYYRAFASSPQSNWDVHLYLARVRAAVEALGLEEVLNVGMLSPSVDATARFHEVRQDLEYLAERYRITRAQRRRNHSVPFDSSTKEKLRHHLSQLREMVDQLAMPESKRRRLCKPISALELEIGKNRTAFESLSALAIEAAGAGAKAYHKLKVPIEGIVKLFAAANEKQPPAYPELSIFLPSRAEGGLTIDVNASPVGAHASETESNA